MEECYMKISVVIAYHDEKQYIKDCLASLAEQTFQDFEVILVCDGCEAPEEGIPEKLNIGHKRKLGYYAWLVALGKRN